MAQFLPFLSCSDDIMLGGMLGLSPALLYVVMMQRGTFISSISVYFCISTDRYEYSNLEPRKAHCVMLALACGSTKTTCAQGDVTVGATS